MNRYDHYPGDYARDTAELNLMQHGAYRLLLDHYYSTEKPIPQGAEFRIVRAFSPEEQRETQWVLDRFFELKDGHWHHDRVDREIAKAQPRIRAAKANGKRGGRPAKTQLVSSENPAANPDETQEKPNGEPRKNPDGGGGGEGDLDQIRGKVSCPASLRLTEDQVASLEVELVPHWAVKQLERDFVADWSQDHDQAPKTIPNWRKYLKGAIRGRWRDSDRRPQKPEPELTPDAIDAENRRRAEERRANEAAAREEARRRRAAGGGAR